MKWSEFVAGMESRDRARLMVALAAGLESAREASRVATDDGEIARAVEHLDVARGRLGVARGWLAGEMGADPVPAPATKRGRHGWRLAAAAAVVALAALAGTFALYRGGAPARADAAGSVAVRSEPPAAAAASPLCEDALARRRNAQQAAAAQGTGDYRVWYLANSEARMQVETAQRDIDHYCPAGS